MKRRKDRPFTPKERRSLLLLTAFLLSAIGLGVWLQMGQHEFSPPPEISMRAGDDLRAPLAELGEGKARIFRFDAQNDEPIRVFVARQGKGRLVATFAACRRCDRDSRRSRVSDGRLICGHCGEPMPILEEGATLPQEKDCTPIPVQFRIEGDSLVVRALDIEAGRALFARNQN